MPEGDWSALWLSLKVAGWCLLLGTGPGIGLGWLLARKKFLGKSLLDALLHAPLVLPPVVTGYFLLMVLGRKAVLGQWLEDALGVRLAYNLSGAVIAAGIMGFPLLVRSVRLAIELVDRDLEVAAATLGARPWRVLATVTLPLALPGILTGMTLAFARALGEFGATITFAGNIEGETRTLPLAVFTYMQVPGKESSVFLLACLSLALSLGALFLSEWTVRRAQRRLRGEA